MSHYRRAAGPDISGPALPPMTDALPVMLQLAQLMEDRGEDPKIPCKVRKGKGLPRLRKVQTKRRGPRK